MEIDRPDDDDTVPLEQANRTVERAQPGPLDLDDNPTAANRPAETRDRATYDAELRAAVAAERGEQAESWDDAMARFAGMWAEHQERWPSAERAVASSLDNAASWRGAGDRALDAETNAQVDRYAERIREIEETTITPAMRRIQAEDPTRELVGLEHRCKGPDRLKEKVAEQVEAQPDLAPEQAMAMVKDSIRFTFQYAKEQYTEGVGADHARLEGCGFELIERRNSWEHEEYKGINSRWREPHTGQLFEVQFHTQVSYEAKQLTHAAYERIRNPDTSETEIDELTEFQRQVCARIPTPSGVTDIDAYPMEKRNA